MTDGDFSLDLNNMADAVDFDLESSFDSGIENSLENSLQTSDDVTSNASRRPTRKRRRKRMLTGVSRQRRAANARERNRIHGVNMAFLRLRDMLPVYGSGDEISKIDTLRLAAKWIAHLTSLLINDDENGKGGGDTTALSASLKAQIVKLINSESDDFEITTTVGARDKEIGPTTADRPDDLKSSEVHVPCSVVDKAYSQEINNNHVHVTGSASLEQTNYANTCHEESDSYMSRNFPDISRQSFAVSPSQNLQHVSLQSSGDFLECLLDHSFISKQQIFGHARCHLGAAENGCANLTGIATFCF